MEFIEDEARPRFLFQGRAAASATPAAVELKVDKLHAAACLSSGVLLLFLSYISFSGTQTLSTLLLWAALSLFLAPFAPPSATGGDVYVGRGDILPDPEPSPSSSDIVEPKRRIYGRRNRSQNPDELPPPPAVPDIAQSLAAAAAAEIKKDSSFSSSGSATEERAKEDDDEGEEKEWTDEDLELLKKQMSKHPVGAPQRWEKIAEAFRGRHGLDCVIRTAKSFSERRRVAGDSFQQFLKQRKPIDRRVEEAIDGGDYKGGIFMENAELKKENEGGVSGNWSSGDDIALLNALKAFPKDASMRWEKIAAAVPGKSKAACMKRVAELKRDFRSSKVSEA